MEFGPVLHNYAENSLLSPDFGAYGIQATLWTLSGNTYEAFGDLEARPPVVSQAGTDWSSGFVFHGSGSGHA